MQDDDGQNAAVTDVEILLGKFVAALVPTTLATACGAGIYTLSSTG